jgi:CBS domain-containing protein
MKVLDLVQSRREVFSVPEDATVHEVARYLRDHQVRSVGVLDAAGQLTGVVSHSDISNKVAAENKCPAWMRVSEIMSRGLVVVRPEMALDECLCLMEKHGVFHLLVEEDSGRYLGMISVADLLQVIASDHKDRADMFEAFVFSQR